MCRFGQYIVLPFLMLWLICVVILLQMLSITVGPFPPIREVDVFIVIYSFVDFAWILNKTVYVRRAKTTPNGVGRHRVNIAGMNYIDGDLHQCSRQPGEESAKWVMS